MAQAPVTPVKPTSAPVEPRKVVGQPEGATLMPLAEPGAGIVTPTVGVDGQPLADGERDPLTIAEEQRRRSAEYETNLGKAPEVKHEPVKHEPVNHASKK